VAGDLEDMVAFVVSKLMDSGRVVSKLMDKVR
jgi:hypothetical protein